MNTEVNIDWEKFITVDGNWVAKHLTQHQIETANKLTLRTYSIQYSGTKYETTALVEFVSNSLKKYILNEKEIKQLEERGIEPYRHALQYFGNRNPSSEGKFGELILYLLTEAILKVPLVVFKIPTNPNDQIKGGDGLFCGNYKNMPAILIGESKTWQSLNDALNDAFLSLDKLHNEYDHSALNYEYFVAKKNIRVDLSKEEIDYLYDCFTPGSEAYKKRILVHPVLIIYNDDRISTIDASDNKDGESKIKILIEEKLPEYLSKLETLCKNHKEVAEVYLDFFFMPLKSVDSFRQALYQALHGAEWRPKLKTE
jgi:hypothetical protein